MGLEMLFIAMRSFDCEKGAVSACKWQVFPVVFRLVEQVIYDNLVKRLMNV